MSIKILRQEFVDSCRRIFRFIGMNFYIYQSIYFQLLSMYEKWRYYYIK
jgi:hypothetical protein